MKSVLLFCEIALCASLAGSIQESPSELQVDIDNLVVNLNIETTGDKSTVRYPAHLVQTDSKPNDRDQTNKASSVSNSDLNQATGKGSQCNAKVELEEKGDAMSLHILKRRQYFEFERRPKTH
ncbi:uncharacterized protein LOC103512115 isoform X5 [Diaphorina citri]|uniref:Uncharacterized protein LOC103512115 isoform X3 n=1 Tax=Diaphorina citri TaxID=121845 RepID=A0A1S4EF34_DIACI|nr:uncharacterized protein LOC103512115 isoform X3 [Diaphorina citri]XP_017300757.1 uncharacterized protein LOC103512115 isoform X4 [Diaphorina citri]XP_017300758.1 uncharacterized protein LOC103512115 isoform X5 [Diaphorina citri]KAI5709471.1 hypothetical protein M8J75_000484 [Diaphorina citri]KAI5745507.1 hypothetical protein M8J76_011571 [Diaphorina citri]